MVKLRLSHHSALSYLLSYPLTDNIMATTATTHKRHACFNRQDIILAYYHFYSTLDCYRGMHYDYDLVAKKSRSIYFTLLIIEAKVLQDGSQLSTISPNAKCIYLNLIDKYLGKTSTRENYPKMLAASKLVNGIN